MFSAPQLRDLFRHMEWADATVWRVIGALDRGSVDPWLRSRLFHVHLVQRAFLQVWKRDEVPSMKAEDFPTLEAVRLWARPYYSEAFAFLGSLDREPERLAEPMAMPWVTAFERRLGRQFETPTLAETAFQVTSHSTYHRGQINRRLRELNVEPALVDYIAWLWFGRPGADWD